MRTTQFGHNLFIIDRNKYVYVKSYTYYLFTGKIINNNIGLSNFDHTQSNLRVIFL